MQFYLSRLKDWLTCRMPGGGRKRESTELMARFSHELRTSLTGIVGYAEYVEKGAGAPMMNFTAKIRRERERARPFSTCTPCSKDR